MIPALDMSKVHSARNSAARDEAPGSRSATGTGSAHTSNGNTAYASIGGSVTTPGRTLPLRNQPTSTSAQLQQSLRLSSSNATPQSSPRGQQVSAQLMKRAQDVEGYLLMNPLSCHDVPTLQRALISTAEAAMRMQRQYEEENKLRIDVFEQRLASVMAAVTQASPASLAGNTTNRAGSSANCLYSTSGGGAAGGGSVSASADKGLSSTWQSRSGRRHPVASSPAAAAASPQRGATPLVPKAATTSHASYSARPGSSPMPLPMEKTPISPGSARRVNRAEAHRPPAPGLAGPSTSSRGPTNDFVSSFTAGAAASGSSENAHATISRPRLDVSTYQDSPVRTREPVRRGSMSAYASGVSGMSYQDLGEGLGFALRSGTSERGSPTAPVHRGPHSGRSPAVSGGVSTERRGGSHSARAPKPG